MRTRVLLYTSTYTSTHSLTIEQVKRRLSAVLRTSEGLNVRSFSALERGSETTPFRNQPNRATAKELAKFYPERSEVDRADSEFIGFRIQETADHTNRLIIRRLHKLPLAPTFGGVLPLGSL